MRTVYDRAVEILKSNHFYPRIDKEITKRGERIIGLTIQCNPVTSGDKLIAVKKVLDEKHWDCRVTNQKTEILIIKKK